MEFNYNPDCCKYCSNNPQNNPSASGICCCSLPYMNTTPIEPCTVTTNVTLVVSYPTTTNSFIY